MAGQQTRAKAIKAASGQVAADRTGFLSRAAAAPTQQLSVSDVKERIRTERDSYSAGPPSVGMEQALVVLNGLLAFIEKGESK